MTMSMQEATAITAIATAHPLHSGSTTIEVDSSYARKVNYIIDEGLAAWCCCVTKVDGWFVETTDDMTVFFRSVAHYKRYMETGSVPIYTGSGVVWDA